MYTYSDWDYRSDPEYLKGENEFLREEYHKLLGNSAELNRLGGMTRDERVAERKAFDQELEEHRRQVEEARAATAKAEQQHTTKTAELDRSFRAAVDKYNQLTSDAKTAEDRKKALNAVSFEFIRDAHVAAEKERFWPNFVAGLVIGIVTGIISSLIYDSLKPGLFHFFTR